MEEKNKIIMTTERKSMKIRPSGRSSDFISPSLDMVVYTTVVIAT